MKPSSIDEHLWKSYYSKKTRRVVKRRGLRSSISQWLHVSEMFSPTGSGNFNPGLKAWAVLFLIVSGFIGGYSWYSQPNNGLFHSQVCVPTELEKTSGLQCGDPASIIYQASAPNGNLAEFNLFSSGSGANTYIASCNGSTPCLQQGSDTSTTSVALSNVTVGDMGIAVKSNLALAAVYQITNAGTIGTNVPWGFFFTTNKTVATHDITSSAAYDPSKDPSVVFLEKFTCSSNCNVASKTISYNTYFLRTIGQKDNILAEDKGCSSGSVFLCQTLSYTSTAFVQSQISLNFTGNQNAGTCSASGIGSGCSYSTLGTLPLPPSVSSTISTQVLPWLQIQSQQYYLGFFVGPNLSSTINWLFGSVGNAASMQLTQYNIVITGNGPTIDTGGPFGSVIRALIAIGVFIMSNIINFFVYLFGLVSGVLIAAFNAIGNGLGIGPIGSSLASIFTGIGSFITSVFGTIFAYVGNFATFLSNGLTAIGNIISTYWTQATTGLSSLSNWLSNAWTVIQAIGFWFKIGFASFLFAWMLYGTVLAFEDYNRFKLEWFNPTELFSIKLFGLTYWIGDKSFDLLWKGLQALKGWL